MNRGEGDDAPDPDAASERVDYVADAEAVANDAMVAEDLERVRAERDAFLDDLQRVQAEFANFRKRMLREQTAHVERASEGVVEQLLPVLDTFELALASLELADTEDAAKLRKGVELVYAELYGVLEKQGLARIEAQSKPFDPSVHEAVLQEESGDGDAVVTDVMRTGYTLKGRVLRPAMVKVSRR